MTTNIRQRNRVVESPPGFFDRIGGLLSSYADRGNPWFSPNSSAGVAAREIEEYKAKTGITDPRDSYLSDRLNSIGSSVGVDPSGFGGGLLGTVKKVVPPKNPLVVKNESSFINKFLDNPNAAFWNKAELDKIKTEAGYGAEYIQDTFRAVRKANLKATIREMKKDGWEVSHTSKHNGKVSSYYMNKGGFDGTTIRVSDHELPETVERMHNRQTFGKPSWDEEIIINSKSSIEEIKTVIKDHLEWFNDV